MFLVWWDVEFKICNLEFNDGGEVGWCAVVVVLQAVEKDGTGDETTQENSGDKNKIDIVQLYTNNGANKICILSVDYPWVLASVHLARL